MRNTKTDNAIIDKYNNYAKNKDSSIIRNNLLLARQKTQKLNNDKLSTNNIIENMLKSEKIEKNNLDIISSYKNREKTNNEKFKPTNIPYKIIIKDHIVSKNVDEIQKEDMIVYKPNKITDANIDSFKEQMNAKELDLDKLNKEIKNEYSIDNMHTNKIKFEYKETFIKSLGFKENIYNQNKQDYIDFYKKRQKETEVNSKMCDQILHAIVDDGLISKDEIPDFVLNG